MQFSWGIGKTGMEGRGLCLPPGSVPGSWGSVRADGSHVGILMAGKCFDFPCLQKVKMNKVCWSRCNQAASLTPTSPLVSLLEGSISFGFVLLIFVGIFIFPLLPQAPDDAFSSAGFQQDMQGRTLAVPLPGEQHLGLNPPVWGSAGRRDPPRPPTEPLPWPGATAWHRGRTDPACISFSFAAQEATGTLVSPFLGFVT